MISPNAAFTMPPGLTSYARRVLTTPTPSEKVRLTQEAAKHWRQLRVIGPAETPPPTPARPPLPRIIPAGTMPSAKDAGVPANVYHLHSIAHVELNAIDLCFDTMLRFAMADDDAAWFADWISIASDEARHFSLLDARLRELGSFYGALPAHGIVWKSAEASLHSRRVRLALGQLVAEAKGLDAGPKLAERLVGGGDNTSAGIVRVIADEEVRHVQIGVKWFLDECERDGIDPVKEFHGIAVGLANPGAFARPFNEERRRKAGLTPEWYVPVAEALERQRAERRAERDAAAAEPTCA